MLFDQGFTKQNLDLYLKELAKEYRKHNRKSLPVEIILIGGASVVINYGFREMTYDMDAIIEASSSMKDAINHVGNQFQLPAGWLNTDFIRTSSYTPKIIQYSKYYKTYSNIVTFRTVTGEYLIAMKLMAGRQYKYDLFDVIGILWEQEAKGEPIALPMIKEASTSLYGSYQSLPKESRTFIEQAIKEGHYEEIYQRIRQIENENRHTLIQFQKDNPNVITTDNVNDILKTIRDLKSKKDN